MQEAPGGIGVAGTLTLVDSVAANGTTSWQRDIRVGKSSRLESWARWYAWCGRYTPQAPLHACLLLQELRGARPKVTLYERYFRYFEYRGSNRAEMILIYV
jgi:hypothetical protein